MFPNSEFSIRKFLLVIAAGIIAGSIAACSEVPVQSVKADAATNAVENGRAFGRIILVEDGKEIPFSKGIFGLDAQSMHIRSVQTGQIHVMDIKVDGSFIWPLQAGEYVVMAYEGPKGPARRMRLWTRFSISQPGYASYIGDLRIENHESYYRFAVEDQYEVALGKIGPQLAEGKFVAEKSLMKPEEQLGTFKRWRGICQDWGIECARDLNGVSGVEPVQPAGADRGFPRTASLTPILEWKPSSKEGLTYDVAVFESLTQTLDLPGAPRMRGDLAAYAEGLHEPRYQITVPLQADKKYDWSVRLRDGDTVSSWSTSSYFVFFIVGAASGSGLWFGLSTPGK